MPTGYFLKNVVFSFEKQSKKQTFIRWVETITNKQESCAINGGNTTQHFNLEKGACQGDPILAYFFIMALEVLFTLIKNNSCIEGLEIFDHIFLYSIYADCTTFFVKNVDYVEEIIKVFDLFSNFLSLKPNLTKCELSGIGVLKGVQLAVCGMKCINLTIDTIKILGIHFSYNELIAREQEKKVSKSYIEYTRSLKIVENETAYNRRKNCNF